jgi:hypothetical protein
MRKKVERTGQTSSTGTKHVVRAKHEWRIRFPAVLLHEGKNNRGCAAADQQCKDKILCTKTFVSTLVNLQN